MKAPSIPDPWMRQIVFREEVKNHGAIYAVEGKFHKYGRTFRAAAITEKRKWLPSESPRMRFEMHDAVYEDLARQVEAFRAVTEPIPND